MDYILRVPTGSASVVGRIRKQTADRLQLTLDFTAWLKGEILVSLTGDPVIIVDAGTDTGAPLSIVYGPAQFNANFDLGEWNGSGTVTYPDPLPDEHVVTEVDVGEWTADGSVYSSGAHANLIVFGGYDTAVYKFELYGVSSSGRVKNIEVYVNIVNV